MCLSLRAREKPNQLVIDHKREFCWMKNHLNPLTECFIKTKCLKNHEVPIHSVKSLFYIQLKRNITSKSFMVQHIDNFQDDGDNLKIFPSFTNPRCSKEMRQGTIIGSLSTMILDIILKWKFVKSSPGSTFHLIKV